MSDKPRIGYLVPEFPSQTHAFFWRELLELEAAGSYVQILSTRRPPTGSCPHDFADAARDRTTYLFPPRFAAAIGGLLRRPVRTARAAWYVATLGESPLMSRLRLMGLVSVAMELVHEARLKNLGHIHIHSCADAAHLGALGHILGDLGYSLTLHGDLAVYGTDHAAKMKRARFVSAVTKPLQRSLEKTVGPGRPYPVIWMGVDTDRFRPVTGRPAREPTEALRVLTVARLNETKGHIYFLRAMAKLRQDGVKVVYCVAGDGPARERIEDEIANLGLHEDVTLLGSVSEDRVLSLLHETDIAALTSFGMGEAAPVSVMEAMACGVPCVTSIIGGTPDMIDDGTDGILVAQKDVDAIAQAVAVLAHDPVRLAEMSRAARAKAEEHFDHRVNARKLLRSIEDTVHHCGNTRPAPGT